MDTLNSKDEYNIYLTATINNLYKAIAFGAQSKASVLTLHKLVKALHSVECIKTTEEIREQIRKDNSLKSNIVATPYSGVVVGNPGF